jgi:hypothetical protein
MLEKLTGLPTIMEIDQEIQLIQELETINDATIVDNQDNFIRVVDHLVGSHVGGAYFQITRENQKVFFDFADWLTGLISRTHIRLDPDLADTFRFSYNKLVAAYPQISDLKD